MNKNLKRAFTLSEVLITLTIIGVVAAITIPVVKNQGRWIQYKSATLKVLSTLDQANIQYRLKKGHIAQCGYWEKNPYGSASCVQHNEAGECSMYQLADGSALPGDYNGNFRDCKELYKLYPKLLNVIKVCESNAYANGCIPKYDGNDTIYRASHADAGDVDVTSATSGCGSFRQEKILNGSAMVLADGTIIFPYGNLGSRLLGVDINGMKGPNKWGYDVRSFQPKMKSKTSDGRFFPGGCESVAKGGISTSNLLYKDISKY